MKPAQLRKDIAHFGQFGTRGLGYSVKDLYSEIKSAMGGSNYHRVILVGVGNLGSALLRYQGFMREGYQVVSSFDAVPQAVITKGLPVPVLAVDQMEPYIRENQIKIAILCVPREQAQEVTNELVAAGITGILNFSSSVLIAPDHVTISCVDLALELENLSYFVS